MAGLQSKFVDTQDATLTGNSITYDQLTDTVLTYDGPVTKHRLTDDTIDNVFDLNNINISGNMWLTTSQWSGLLLLTKDVSGVRPTHDWVLSWTNQSDDTATKVTMNGQLKTLRPIDSGIGAVKIFFVIEGDGVTT